MTKEVIIVGVALGLIWFWIDRSKRTKKKNNIEDDMHIDFRKGQHQSNDIYVDDARKNYPHLFHPKEKEKEKEK